MRGDLPMNLKVGMCLFAEGGKGCRHKEQEGGEPTVGDEEVAGCPDIFGKIAIKY